MSGSEKCSIVFDESRIAGSAKYHEAISLRDGICENDTEFRLEERGYPVENDKGVDNFPLTLERIKRWKFFAVS